MYYHVADHYNLVKYLLINQLRFLMYYINCFENMNNLIIDG